MNKIILAYHNTKCQFIICKKLYYGIPMLTFSYVSGMIFLLIINRLFIIKGKIIVKTDNPLAVSRDTENLREMALKKVKSAILTGYFKPKQRLIERSLCDELNVSRTVVREIIRYLEAEGLVESIPNKGPIVASLDPDATEQIYKMRLMIEKDVAAQCAVIADDSVKKKLNQALQEINKNYNSNDIISLIDSISDFYKVIFDATEQTVAWDVVKRLNGKISRLRAMTLSTSNRKTTGYQRMQHIYEAIENNDPERAENATVEHIKEASKIAQQVLKNNEETTINTKVAKGYWIADVTVTNSEQYSQYVKVTPTIIKKYGGKFIVRGGDKHILEGETNERQVIIEFESMTKALECYHSKEYKAAKEHRKDACIANVIIVEGGS